MKLYLRKLSGRLSCHYSQEWKEHMGKYWCPEHWGIKQEVGQYGQLVFMNQIATLVFSYIVFATLQVLLPESPSIACSMNRDLLSTNQGCKSQLCCFHGTDKSMVVGHVPTAHTWSSMCTSHIDMTTHTPAFLQVGKHFRILLYAHTTSVVEKRGSRPLAATSVSEVNHPQMVTYPNTNRAHSYLTLVMGQHAVAHCNKHPKLQNKTKKTTSHWSQL